MNNDVKNLNKKKVVNYIVNGCKYHYRQYQIQDICCVAHVSFMFVKNQIDNIIDALYENDNIANVEYDKANNLLSVYYI